MVFTIRASALRGALAVRRIPVCSIVVIAKIDIKPKTNQFYKYPIPPIVIRAITLNHGILARFYDQIAITFIFIKYYK